MVIIFSFLYCYLYYSDQWTYSSEPLSTMYTVIHKKNVAVHL